MKIITALMNEKLSEKLRKYKEIEVLCKDIQYQEALLEILEKNKEIDVLVLSSILPGESDIYELINLIKYKNEKIKIYIILDKQNDKIKEFLIKKGINNIFINNQITEEELINKIINKNEEKTENTEKINFIENRKIDILSILKKYIYSKKIKKVEIKKQAKIISIVGSPKVGKSIFSILLSLTIQNKKILLIEYNSQKNDLNTFLGKKEKREIQKYRNIDFFHEYENTEKLENLKNKYDYIFVDIGILEQGKEIIEKSDISILLVEPNLIGIKEASKILEILIKKWNIKKEKIKIIYNKTNIFSINRLILNQLFSDFQILGNIKNSNYYNFLINSNFKFMNKKITKEYEKITKKI